MSYVMVRRLLLKRPKSSPNNSLMPFSVSQLKDTAANVKSSSSDKFQNVRAKYSSLSSANSSYNPRDPKTKAPPPPPQRDEIVEEIPQQSGPPAPPIPRSTRPDAQISRPPAIKQSELEGIRWSALSQNDKAIFFGWLDEYFGARGSSTGVDKNRVVSNPATTNVVSRRSVDGLNMSYPPRSEHGSAAQDLCVFFSSSTRWDVPWYSSQSPIPPPLEQVTDCSRTYSTQWHGDSHTLTGGALFGDLSACWYTVQWSGRTANDTTKARRSAGFIPKPDPLSQDELIAAHETYGETVAGFAEGYEGTGQFCARGECWDLANEALKAFEQWDYVPKPLPCIGRTHGHLIFEGKAWGKNANTQQAGRWRGGDDRIRRGDIVQWKSATITEGHRKFTIGSPDHTAIIVRDQQLLKTPRDTEAMRPADLGQLEVVEQSVHSPPSRQVYQLSGMEAGELWIYRPIGMEVYLKFTFSANWPEGLQPTASA